VYLLTSFLDLILFHFFALILTVLALEELVCPSLLIDFYEGSFFKLLRALMIVLGLPPDFVAFCPDVALESY